MKRSLNFEKMLWAEVSLRSYQTAYFAGDWYHVMIGTTETERAPKIMLTENEHIWMHSIPRNTLYVNWNWILLGEKLQLIKKTKKWVGLNWTLLNTTFNKSYEYSKQYLWTDKVPRFGLIQTTYIRVQGFKEYVYQRDLDQLSLRDPTE
jgi:hypothetical protein